MTTTNTMTAMIEARAAYATLTAAETHLAAVENALASLAAPLPEVVPHAERRAIGAASMPLIDALIARRDAARSAFEAFAETLGRDGLIEIANAVDAAARADR